MFTCYELKCNVFGDTYIGVTGQKLTRRTAQHYRSEKFPDGFTVEVLATSSNRSEINKIERDMIAQRRPTMNTRKGGNSASGYHSRRKQQTHCKFGHALTGDNVRIQSNGRRRCLTCYREKEGRWRPRKLLS